MFPFEADLASAAEHRQATGRPLVTLAYAQSLDGSLASQRGRPLALSGPLSMRLTHQLRAAHTAILVGIGTVLADDPRLTVRLVAGSQPQPVILDSSLRIPLEARLVAEPIRAPWVATTAAAPEQRRRALAARGVRLLDTPPGPEGWVDLPVLLSLLAENGIDSLMVEGGASVIASFLSHRLVDQVVLTLAPCFVGGLPALGASLAGNFPRLEQMQVKMLGEDLILWGTLDACR